MWTSRKKKQRTTATWWTRLGVREEMIRRRISYWLETRSRNISIVRLRWYFLLLFLGWCLLNTWIFTQSLNDAEHRMEFKSVTLPVTAGKKEEKPRGLSTFRQELDSIDADPVLKKSFDSLLKVRPDFEETVRQLEEIYPARH